MRNYLSKISRNHSKRLDWIVFIIIFVSSMVYAAITDIRTYVFDSGYYWTITDPVFEGNLNLLNFPYTFRGYLFPFLTGTVKYLFHGVWGWRVLSSFLCAGTYSFSLPFLISGRRIKSYTEIFRTLLAYAFFMWIWGNFMQYPLSDFAAAAFLLTGVSILKSFHGTDLHWETITKGIAVGLSLYAAYNTRATFLYGAAFAAIIFLITNRKDIKKAFCLLAFALISAFLIALPQCLINEQYIGIFSPKVHTEAYSNNPDVDLQKVQVFQGIGMDRRETYSGSEQLHYPQAAVFFEDPVGQEILRRRNLSVTRFSIPTVFKLMLEFPLDMIGIYTRHLISLMTPMYRQIYIDNLYPDKGIWTSVSALVWIIAGFAVLKQWKWKKSLPDSFWILSVCLPSFLQLFGSPEIRFFLPVYLLCYYYVFAAIDYRSIVSLRYGQWIRPALCILVVFILWMTIFGNILSNSQVRTFIIHDSLQGQGIIGK